MSVIKRGRDGYWTQGTHLFLRSGRCLHCEITWSEHQKAPSFCTKPQGDRKMSWD